jgi:hypothetical protein
LEKLEFNLALLEEEQLCWVCHIKEMIGTRISGHEELKFKGKGPIEQPKI